MTAIEKIAYSVRDWQTENINYKETGKNKPIPFYELLKPFLEMEKQQIITFTDDFIEKHCFGDYDGRVQKNKTSEQYYNETFKNK